MDGWKAYSNRMEYRPKTNINQIDEGNLSQGEKSNRKIQVSFF